MNGLTRAPITLLAAAVAGGLLWVATRFDDHANSGYWAAYGVIAGAGLVLAASQLAGGWTKGGRLVISPWTLLFAFVPALIAAGWIVVAGQPHGSTTRSHVLSWSQDLGIRDVVTSLTDYVGVLAFGLGLLFGLSFDTTGPAMPRTAVVRDWRREPAAPPPPEPEADTVVGREPVGAGVTRERVG